YRYEPAVQWMRGAPDPVRFGRFGGWLFLMGLHAIAAPFVLTIQAINSARTALSQSFWHALSTPALPSYRPGLALASIGELIMQLGFAAYAFALLALFLRRRRAYALHF